MTNRRHFIMQSAAAAGLAALPIEGKTRSENCASVSSDEAGIAEAFVRARLEGRLLAHYPGTIPADLPSAYRCQDAAIARWPRPIGGWKLTGRWFFNQEHLFGPVFEGNIRSAAPGEVVECPMFLGGFGDVEAEVMIRVGRDAPPEQTHWRLIEAAEMVGEMCIGAEVASSPLLTIIGPMNAPSATSIVSDFGATFGIVVGSPIPDWQTREKITTRSYVGDTLAGQTTHLVRDDILEKFRATLVHCARRGYPLRAGMVITTSVHSADPGGRPSSPAPAQAPPPSKAQAGVVRRIVFDGLGEFTCRTVQATGGVWSS